MEGARSRGRRGLQEDLLSPGMLYGKILRSPVAHAKILHIDASRARALPGVMAVITGKDFPGIPFGTRPDTRDQLPMPIAKVHHFGEGVAAVAALDEDTAEEALDLIQWLRRTPGCSRAFRGRTQSRSSSGQRVHQQ